MQSIPDNTKTEEPVRPPVPAEAQENAQAHQTLRERQMARKQQARKLKARRKSRPVLLIVIALVLIAAAAGGYYYYRQTSLAAQKSTGPDYNTSTVRRGDLTISASGTGTLVPAQQDSLSFSASGTVAKLNVQVGDAVKQGQILAQLDTIDALTANVNSAQQNLISAQQALDTLKAGGPANIANAQIALSNAQKAIDTAKSGLIQPGMARCDQTTTDAYYSQYMVAQQNLQKLGDGGGNQSYYLTTIVPAKNAVSKAWNAYTYCAGFYDYEVSASKAKLDLANAQYQQAQDSLTLLQKNNGVNPTDLASAENKVATAQQALTQAQETLDGATIKAPFDGTILAVNGQAGDTAGTAAFITIADLAHPQIQFVMDETDMANVAMNEPATVTFDALPNQAFNGKVIRINPSLVTSNNVNTVQGILQLTLTKAQQSLTLPANMTAAVTLIKAQAQNVLIVPVAALRDLGGGSYGVFVLTNGQPRLKVVTVGLQDAANAEIKSGLQAGNVVTTGLSGTRSTSNTGSGSSNGSNAGSTRPGQGQGQGGGQFRIPGQ